MSNWDFAVATGNADVDRNTVEAYRQQAAASGMQFDVQPLPTGGYRVRMWAAQAQQQQPQYAQQPQQQQWGQPAQQQQQQPSQWGQGAPQQQQQQQQQWGQQQPVQQAGFGGAPFAQPTGGGAMAMNAGAAFGAGAATSGVAPLEAQRVAYLRRVYGLLGGAAFIAIAVGMAAITLGPTEAFATEDGVAVQVPMMVALMLGNRIMLYAAFGLLFVATLGASAVSKVKGLNVVALFGVAALMGFELAPMVFVANVMAGLGRTMTANPVRDAFVMVGAVFAGITSYIYITRKDFSYLRATLSMGFVVIFAACILAGFVGSEPLSLAVATAGALLAGGFLLYITSYIFRNSEMDDPVGDALAVLVQLRNLFMFLLRIFMSSRD